MLLINLSSNHIRQSIRKGGGGGGGGGDDDHDYGDRCDNQPWIKW